MDRNERHMNTWKAYFKPPFILDEYDPGIIWSSDYEMVTSPTDQMDRVADHNLFGAEHAMQAVVEALNAKCEGRRPDCSVQFENVKYSGTSDNAVVSFTAGDEMSIQVRCWGMLTGSKNLSPDEAAAIQDAFGRFIADSLIEAGKEV